MKVWIVTSGEYSAYEIEGVFSTREKADRFIRDNARAHADNFHEPCEWTVDELQGMAAVYMHPAEITLETGEVKTWQGYLITRNPKDRSCEIAGVTARHSVVGMDDPSAILCNVHSPVSHEHAIKIATEQRQAWLRKKTEP